MSCCHVPECPYVVSMPFTPLALLNLFVWVLCSPRAVAAEQYGLSREGSMSKGYVERALRPFLDASRLGPMCCSMIICMLVLACAEGTCGVEAESSR